MRRRKLHPCHPDRGWGPKDRRRLSTAASCSFTQLLYTGGCAVADLFLFGFGGGAAPQNLQLVPTRKNLLGERQQSLSAAFSNQDCYTNVVAFSFQRFYYHSYTCFSYCLVQCLQRIRQHEGICFYFLSCVHYILFQNLRLIIIITLSLTLLLKVFAKNLQDCRDSHLLLLS